MTVDIEKLEALAKAATGDCVQWYTLEQLKSRAVDESAAELMAFSTPAAVLDLTQTIRDLQSSVQGLKTGYEAYERVNAGLRAECEKLRKDSARYQWTSTEGNWVARYHGKWRAHVGEYGVGQPTDWYPTREEAIDAAMSKEQSHD